MQSSPGSGVDVCAVAANGKQHNVMNKIKHPTPHP
jgi:hypothetical protein